MLMLSSFYSSLVYSFLDTTVAFLWDTTVDFVRNKLFQAVPIDTEDQLIAAHFGITGVILKN